MGRMGQDYKAVKESRSEKASKNNNHGGKVMEDLISKKTVIDIPIVYDVDKVINQLKRKSFERYGNGGMGGELVVNLDDVFDIVKGGGLDE